jgi:hypothetical protein
MQKKYVFVMNAIELLQKLVMGKRVEGVLYMDEDTGKLTFKAYNRTCPKKRAKDRLICALENGWLKESPQRIKFFNSVKKELGVPRITEVMARELDAAMSAMIREKLAEFREKTIDDILDEV